VLIGAISGQKTYLLESPLFSRKPQSILISEINMKKQNLDLIPPIGSCINLFDFFDQLANFPTMDEIRAQAWPKIL